MMSHSYAVGKVTISEHQYRGGQKKLFLYGSREMRLCREWYCIESGVAAKHATVVQNMFENSER